jgi:hypothetical protein
MNFPFHFRFSNRPGIVARCIGCRTAYTSKLTDACHQPLQVGVPIPSKIPAGLQRGQFLRLVEAKIASGGDGVSIPVSIRRQASWEGSAKAVSDPVQVWDTSIVDVMMSDQRSDTLAIRLCAKAHCTALVTAHS